MILDTNAVSAVLAGNLHIHTKLPPGERQHLLVPVIGEYLFGISGSKYRKALSTAFARLESNSIVLRCDRQTADTYAAIRRELKVRGRPIPHNDLWVAALARQHELEIVSQDSHFDHIEGIHRIGW